jgi:hypothetical protein
VSVLEYQRMRLLNLRRLGGDALTAVGTNERERFFHAGRRCIRRAAVRALHTHTNTGRPEETLRGELLTSSLSDRA